MDQVAHEVRHQKWLDLINQCNASGLTRKEWCRLHGISTKTFYYRQKQLRNEAFALSVKSDAQNKLISSGTAFAEIEVPQSLPPEVFPCPNKSSSSALDTAVWVASGQAKDSTSRR